MYAAILSGGYAKRRGRLRAMIDLLVQDITIGIIFQMYANFGDVGICTNVIFIE